MMHIVKTGSVETTNYVHDIPKDHCSMESSRLGILAIFISINFCPFSLIKLIS